MNLTKCNKGHYYDGDKFSSCPFCGGSGPAGDSVTVAAGTNASDVTVSMPSGALNNDPVTAMNPSYDDPVTQKSAQTGVTGEYIPDIPNLSDIAGSSSLPSDDAVTQSYYRPMMDNVAEQPIATEPVVGWLVCTSGQYFGRSFPLKAGRNFVGRSPQMDVSLSGENSVSRDRHAVIIYEPRGRMFIAQPGDSRELFYLNDKVVLDNEKLSPYDVISVGKVNMMLIPFCTDRFAWEDLEEDKKDAGEGKKQEEKKNASGIHLNKETKEIK